MQGRRGIGHLSPEIECIFEALRSHHVSLYSIDLICADAIWEATKNAVVEENVASVSFIL